jgi:hypothetical protein
MKPVKGRKKWQRGGSQLQGDVESQRNWPEVIVDPGGSWLPPAGRCPAVQQWHGAREISWEKLGPWKIVGHARSLLQLE